LSLLATLDTPFTDNFQEEQIAGTLHEAKAGMTAQRSIRRIVSLSYLSEKIFDDYEY
jgi:hypothetical protein